MKAPEIAASADDEWKRGWPMVLSAFFGTSIIAVVFYTQGVFLKPISAAFGWSRAETSAAALILSVMGVVGQPLIGQVVDRIGARPLLLVGWAIGMSAFACMGLMPGNYALYLMAWCFVGLGLVSCGAVVLSSGLSTRFSRHRGAAIAVALSGVHVFGVTVPYIAAGLITDFGWRNAYFILAGATFAVGFSSLALAFFDVSPARRAHEARTEGVRDANPKGLTLRQALKTRELRLFVIIAFLAGAGLVSIASHLIPLLTDRGMSPQFAAIAFSANGVIAFLTGAFGAFLFDRIPFRFLMALILLIPAIGVLVIAADYGGLPELFVAVAATGVGSGAIIPALSVFVVRYMGMAHYPSIFGVIMAVFSSSQGFGVVLVGAVHDQAGAYTPALVGVVCCLVISAALMLFLPTSRRGRPPPRNSYVESL